jgi:hypothetical protein
MDNNPENAPLEDATLDGQATDSAAVESHDEQSSQPSEGGETMAGKFKSVEELEKAYLEAQKTLTQTSQKAKKAEELETTNKKLNAIVGKIADEQGVTVDTVLQALNEEVGDDSPTVEDEVKALKKQLAERTFIDEHPEVKDNLDLIKSVATSKGITLEEAVEDPAIKRVLDLQSKAARPSVVESTNKLSRNDSTRRETIKKVRDGNISDRDIGKLLLGGNK